MHDFSNVDVGFGEVFENSTAREREIESQWHKTIMAIHKVIKCLRKASGILLLAEFMIFLT